jgi:hypothetical protein
MNIKGKEAMVTKLPAMIPVHKVSDPLCLTWKEDLANQLY